MCAIQAPSALPTIARLVPRASSPASSRVRHDSHRSCSSSSSSQPSRERYPLSPCPRPPRRTCLSPMELAARRPPSASLACVCRASSGVQAMANCDQTCSLTTRARPSTYATDLPTHPRSHTKHSSPRSAPFSRASPPTHSRVWALHCASASRSSDQHGTSHA